MSLDVMSGGIGGHGSSWLLHILENDGSVLGDVARISMLEVGQDG
jgi:hypothetical protein